MRWSVTGVRDWVVSSEFEVAFVEGHCEQVAIMGGGYQGSEKDGLDFEDGPHAAQSEVPQPKVGHREADLSSGVFQYVEGFSHDRGPLSRNGA